MVHQESSSCTPPVHKTQLYLRILRVGRRLNELRSNWTQRLLVIKNAFRVQILEFQVIDVDCRDKLRHGCFVLVHPCVLLHRSVRINWLTWTEIFEDVYDVTGVVLDFQIQQLAVVNDPCTRFKMHRQENFWVRHHSASVYKLKNTSLNWSKFSIKIASKIQNENYVNNFVPSWHRTVWWLWLAVRSSSVCVVECYDSHHVVSPLFQFHRIAALVINSENFRMGFRDFLHFCSQRDSSPSFTNVTVTSPKPFELILRQGVWFQDLPFFFFFFKDQRNEGGQYSSSRDTRDGFKNKKTNTSKSG